MTGDPGGDHPVFRRGGISYLEFPARDGRRLAEFYEAVFGWRVDTDRDEPSFEDGTGHVIGHFVSGLGVAGDAGIRPYVFVPSVDDALGKVVDHGGDVVKGPSPEGDLWVASFRDLAGSVVGVWQQGPRADEAAR
jgi:predicted enzyme related to lactoylglutathione lyase